MSKTIHQKIWEVAQSLPTLQKEAQGYKFKYVELETIVEKLKPLLKEHSLGYAHSTYVSEDGFNILRTTVFDESSNVYTELRIPDNVSLPGMNPYQSLGSGLTYFRRYNLLNLFDIIADEDADATTRKPVKVDYVRKVTEFIASGKYTRTQVENWFSKKRGVMTDEQRVEAHALIENMES